MPELVVIHKPLYYGGKEVAVGAKFNATPTDATWLKKQGKAQDAPAEKPLRKVAETKPLAATEDAAEPASEAPLSTPRRFYGTRRLKAEE
jgi:hypothetical protein